MDAHFVGSREMGQGTSLAVWQFVELVRGERSRVQPFTPFRVVELVMEPMYCMGCFDLRLHDVARDEKKQVWYTRCRCCGRERGT